jgi:predicted dehydrogenase
MSKKITFIQRRDFIKKTSLGLFGLALSPAAFANIKAGGRLRTAHIGVGNMGLEDLKAISSHAMVDVAALCDVDSNNLATASKLFPNAKTYSDYRIMLKEMEKSVDAVIISTPDHTHAPASIMAMKLDKPVYCQKPLTHHVTEARKMKALAKKNNLVTQMGIQVHSFYDYKLATLLIQSGVIGKVHTVRAWSPKNWGYDGPAPVGSDPIPAGLDWDLWLGTSAARPFKEDVYHPGNWRQLVDYGCGTLGDMGVHIFDTPYNALELDVPQTIVNECREPNGFGYPVNNTVTYEFPATKYTAETLKWVWYDGQGAPPKHEDLMLPNGEELPDQGAMFIGENGRLLLPHFQQLPRKIVDGEYVEMDIESFNLGKPVKDYASESKKHYHQFVDACLGKGETTAPFEYSAKLTETILLGVIAGRFPNETLNWDSKKAKFAEKKANKFLNGKYRKF